ncbi:MAG: RloB family protein, partial [Bacteroidales bacterium]
MKTRKPRQKTFVVGEGETEKYYFKHLKELRNYGIKVQPRFFNKKNSIQQIAKKTKNLMEADVMVLCVFDADVAQRNAKEKSELLKFKRKYKDNKNVIICDSLPAIEFWFLLHYK